MAPYSHLVHRNAPCPSPRVCQVQMQDPWQVEGEVTIDLNVTQVRHPLMRLYDRPHC